MSLTDMLRDAINNSDLNYRALERETGVIRQSLMKFARGETSLRLDIADKLAAHFKLELKAASAKAASESKAKQPAAKRAPAKPAASKKRSK